MDIDEIIKIALLALKTNKVRSFLTMLGVIIGVSAVILLVSIGSGLQYFITSQFENLGSNIIIVMPGKILSEDGNFSGMQGAPNFSGSKLSFEHINDLSRIGFPIKDVIGRTETPLTISAQGKTLFTTVMGVTANYSSVRNTKSQAGRFIINSDVSSSKKIAIIGPTVRDKLFNKTSPIGKEIRLGESRFKVVGVVEKKGGGFGIDIDNAVYIPITAAQKLLNIDNLQVIEVKVSSKEDITAATRIVKNYFKKNLKEDEFSVVDQGELLKTIESILSALTLALGGIAAISLFVGGIGIMNIMLVSVTERVHEIGLRKAIGATPQNIAIQFLIEAVVLSLAGGIIGILLGIGGSLIINIVLKTQVTLWSILIAFTVSSLVGIIFGVAPAIRASRLNPIDALRYE